ncbi:hypothetical protein O3G_MSEX012962 [Manduca sexta]|uniref:Uncharacterized protein n=1 Tax=Manduca sexta TaxID=7130 RepID=A0A922CXJ7_MANSE|nr:hypothetical protein O3G_MSEX012962 [Manduca sexta]
MTSNRLFSSRQNQFAWLICAQHTYKNKIIMLKNYYVLVFLFVFILDAESQRNVGDPCADRFTNTAGVCRPVNECQSARIAAERNGIQPTFCVYNGFGTTLVCCLDGSSILQRGSPNIDDRPIWGSSSSSKRVSERKCEEYSRGVVERVDYIPLLPDPEPFTITAAKCDYTGVELIVGGENAVQGEFPHMVGTSRGWKKLSRFLPRHCNSCKPRSRVRIYDTER